MIAHESRACADLKYFALESRTESLYTTVRYDRCVALAVGRLAVRSPRLTRGQAEAAPGGRSLGAPPPRPSLLAASARRRRRASQMFSSALTGRMHKQHISDPSSCYILLRTVARAWTCCVHEPPEVAWPPPPTAPAVRSTATLRRLALLLAVAAKLASQRLETPLLLPRLPRLPSSPLMLPRQPDCSVRQRTERHTHRSRPAALPVSAAGRTPTESVRRGGRYGELRVG